MSVEGTRKRVLVVDGDSHTRQMVKNALETATFQVEIVADGDQALVACRRQAPHALIVASKLPRMDGFVFLRKMRQEGLLRIIPVVMLAEEHEQPRSGLALTRGARAFFTKPLVLRKLVKEVVELTRKESTATLRHQERIAHAEPVEVRREGGEAFETLSTANVSQGGAFIISDRPPPPFSEVALRFPSQPEVVINAQVRHVVQPDAASAKAPAGMGIRFRDGDERTVASVARLVERAMLPKATLKPLVKKAVRKDKLRADAGAKATRRDTSRPEAAAKELVRKQRPEAATKELVRKERPEAAAADEEKLLERLGRDHERIKAQTFWERLDVGREADIDEVTRAFSRASAAYNSDRYQRHGRKVRDLAQDIYLLLSEAKSALRRAARATARRPQSSTSSRPAPGSTAPAPAPPEAPAPAEPKVTARAPSAPPPAPADEPEADVWTLPAVVPAASIIAPSLPVTPPAALENDASPAPAAVDVQWLESLKEAELDAELGLPSIDDPIEPPPPSEPSSPEDEELARRRNQALAALASGRYRDAKNQLARLIDRGHDDNELLLAERLARAYLCREEGDDEGALAHLEQARALDPESAAVAAASRAISDKGAAQHKGLLRRLLGG